MYYIYTLIHTSIVIQLNQIVYSIYDIEHYYLGISLLSTDVENISKVSYSVVMFKWSSFDGI